MLKNIRKNSNILILLAITLLAGVLRFFALDRFPPGLHFDEAFHQVEAVEILKGVTPIYFTENMGMDPMHIYLIAALFRLVGVAHTGGRLISALAGTLTIPALWWLIVELFAQWETGAKTMLTGISTFTLATLQWHLTLSRTGIQPVLAPLLLTLALAALWRGLRTGSPGWFVAAGVALGLGPYAYSSARVTPLLIVFVLGWLLLCDRPLLRRRWWGFVICVIVSILVFAPLGAYFVAHWEQFTYRSAQVTHYTLGAGSDDPLKALGQNLLDTLAAFNFKGDLEPIRNLPGRPALNPFQSFLFWIGLGICLWRARRPEYALLPAWLGVMLLPTVLTEFAPHFGRALGVTPAVAVLVGLAATAGWQSIRQIKRQEQVVLRKILLIALVICLALSAIDHLYAYFARWGAQPVLVQAYDAGLLETARAVRAHVGQSDVYLSPIQMGHPIVRFVTWDRHGAKSYDGRYALVLPAAPGRPADFVIVPYLDGRSLERLARCYPAGQIVDAGGVHNGGPFYQVFRVPAGSAPQIAPQHPLDVAWRDGLRLIGYDLDKEAYRAGEAIVLTLYWQSAAPTTTDYTAFTHLLGEVNPQTGSPVWAGADHEPGLASYPTSAWAAGEIVLDEFVLYTPANLPAGDYQLQVGFYRLATMQRLDIAQANVETRDHAARIGHIKILD